MIDRRGFLAMTGAAAAGANLAQADAKLPIKKAVYYEMLPEKLSVADRFKMAHDAGFAEVECPTTPKQADAEAMKKAAEAAGIRIHSVMNQAHWEFPLSSSDPAVVAKSMEGMKTSLQNAHFWGADTVLLVPAVVNKQTRYQDAWTRSQKADPRVAPARREVEGHHRHRRGVEQVPAQPARDAALRGRVQEPVREGLPRCRQHGALRLSAGLDPAR